MFVVYNDYLVIKIEVLIEFLTSLIFDGQFQNDSFTDDIRTKVRILIDISDKAVKCNAKIAEHVSDLIFAKNSS